MHPKLHANQDRRITHEVEEGMWGEAQDTRKQAAACGSAKKATRSLILKSEPKASRQGCVVKYAYSLPQYGDTSRSANKSLVLLSSRYGIREVMGTTQMLSAGANSSCRTVFPFSEPVLPDLGPGMCLGHGFEQEVTGPVNPTNG